MIFELFAMKIRKLGN